MIFDLHVHIAGSPASHSGNYLSSRLKTNWAFRIFARRFGLSWQDLQRPESSEVISSKTLSWLNESRVDRAVLLALDAAYRLDGKRHESKTLLVVDNDFVADVAASHKKALFGASVHPYREDALAELDRVVERGACLIKWLPSAQNIEPDHPRCYGFYEKLAHYGIPLLCHTGTEHTLASYPDSFNDPCRLLPALERGVTVIAAHCGTRLLLYRKSYFQTWQKMALEHERFYGDLGAFVAVTRLLPLRRILKNPVLLSKALFGSDFPALAMPLAYLGQIKLSRALELRRIENPFDQSLETMQAAGVPSEVFGRAEKILRIPPAKVTVAKPGEAVVA